MSFLDLLKEQLHSHAIKEFLKTTIIAVKQLGDEAGAAAVGSQPIAAPVIAIAEPLADSFFDALIARIQHLENNQDAKAQAAQGVVQTPPASDPQSQPS